MASSRAFALASSLAFDVLPSFVVSLFAIALVLRVVLTKLVLADCVVTGSTFSVCQQVIRKLNIIKCNTNKLK